MDVSGGYDEAIGRYCQAQRRVEQDESRVQEMMATTKDYIKENSLEPNRSPEFIRNSKASSRVIYQATSQPKEAYPLVKRI